MSGRAVGCLLTLAAAVALWAGIIATAYGVVTR